MTFVEIRNTLVSRLAAALGIPVLLADQVQPETALPCVVYSVTSPYSPNGELGDHSQAPVEGSETAVIDTRREQPSATFSFTACSENRWAPDGLTYIYGDDEAEEIVEKAVGYLLHVGYNDLSNLGIVVCEVMNVGNRSTLIIDEEARRYGFDIRIRYTKADKRTDAVVDTVVTKN